MEEGTSETTTLTEADKGTVAIMTTLKKLDRQVEEVTREITAYVLRSPLARQEPAHTQHDTIARKQKPLSI